MLIVEKGSIGQREVGVRRWDFSDIRISCAEYVNYSTLLYSPHDMPRQATPA